MTPDLSSAREQHALSLLEDVEYCVIRCSRRGIGRRCDIARWDFGTPASQKLTSAPYSGFVDTVQAHLEGLVAIARQALQAHTTVASPWSEV